MHTVHADPILNDTREGLSACKIEILLGCKSLRANPSPPLEDVRLMCDAIVEYFTAQSKYEQLSLAERVSELEVQAKVELLAEKLGAR
jgi:hypothetical protein